MPHDSGRIVATPAAASGQVKAVSELSLLSWNVASWKTALAHIEHFGGLATFLKRHQADILCLQETKLTNKTIADEFLSLGADVMGYESFWACNNGKGSQRQGLNGVATFARKGIVVRADPAPLKSPDLDNEGRCILTDHGSFVLFNVYVPNSGAGRLPFKMRWLEALRVAMQRERKAGKVVILAGDLNMKHRPKDVQWSGRLLSLDSLQRFRMLNDTDPQAQALATMIYEHWPVLYTALREKREVHSLDAKNVTKTSARWAVFAADKDGKPCRLGPQFDTEVLASTKFVLDGIGCNADGTYVFGEMARDAPFIVQHSGAIPAGELMECITKILRADVNRDTLKIIVDAVGENPTEPQVADWFNALLTEDNMVDSFATFHPNACDRFTCWDQFKGLRHENLGSRIDYILVDQEFFTQYAKSGLELYQGGAKGGQHGPDSSEAALAAATLSGLMEPRSLAENSTGMAELQEEEYNAQFQIGPCSGIIYTPQQLSDHTAVSLFLQGVDLSPPQVLSSDPCTRLSQPHRSVKRISSFFLRKPSSSEFDAPAKRPLSTTGSTPDPVTKRQAMAGA